ncbi:hypothetical protein EC844_10592 [Acinetobacter calcoaceticus]|uniref:Uncharacterized protein n=1 Tax=Acinetobacter calcoaceticus TaxID=471 RepID=A0A4R1XXA1_ACICA|nr:hypothetical protein EC844_10592 [Acinetobacter calcoaceticus]
MSKQHVRKKPLGLSINLKAGEHLFFALVIRGLFFSALVFFAWAGLDLLEKNYSSVTSDLSISAVIGSTISLLLFTWEKIIDYIVK